MRSTTFLTTALQIGTFLTAVEAARPRRRQAPGYGANEDSVQWGAWSATTLKTVTTPYHHPEETMPAYNTWAPVTTQAYKPPHYMEEDDEDWNDWEEDQYTTTKKPFVESILNNLLPTMSSKQVYNSWEHAPKQHMTTEQYNSWEHAKPSPTTFSYQSWVGTAKRYNNDNEEYQGWQETSVKTPEVYQTWSKAAVTPVEDYNTWEATPTHVISYTTKVVTIEEYQTWTQATYSTEAYNTWSEAPMSTEAYQTWSQATAVPTKPVEQVQEWAQWEGQQGNGHGYQSGNGIGHGNGPYSMSTTTPFIAIPTGAGVGGLGGLGAGNPLGALAGGLDGGLAGAAGAGLPI